MATSRPSRHHGFRSYAADHDRLKRALLQPVQPWDKKWQYPNNGGKNFKILKWTKSDRKLTFNDDDDDDEGGIVRMTRQLANFEDTPTPTASIIQPPTEASTPQPSETETDSTLLRPHITSMPKSSSLLRQASLTSAVSTPGDNLNTNNNNTPLEVESSVANSPEIEELEEEEGMEEVEISQTEEKHVDLGYSEHKDDDDLFNRQVSSFSEGNEYINKSSGYEDQANEDNEDEYEDEQNEDYDDNRIDEDYDENIEDYEGQSDEDGDQNEEYGNPVPGYPEQLSEYEEDPSSDYGRASEYGGQSNSYIGRASDYDEGQENNDGYGEALSEYDEHSSDYGEQQSDNEGQTGEFVEQSEERTDQQRITYHDQVTAFVDQNREILADAKEVEEEDGEYEDLGQIH